MAITGEDIIKKREELGWKQQRLADYLKITRESVSRYENGKPIGASIRKKLIAFLDLSPIDETKYEKLSISGYYKIRVPFISTKSYTNFITKNELDKTEIEFISKHKNPGKFIAFEVDTKSMDNGSRDSLSEYDIVLTKEINKDKLNEEYEDSGIWIILIGESIICRTIESYNVLENKISCKPLNPSPDFSDLELKVDSIKRLYKVVKRTTDF